MERHGAMVNGNGKHRTAKKTSNCCMERSGMSPSIKRQQSTARSESNNNNQPNAAWSRMWAWSAMVSSNGRSHFSPFFAMSPFLGISSPVSNYWNLIL
jgi:hypothetical protein